MEEPKKQKGRKLGSTRRSKPQKHVNAEIRPDSANAEEEDAFFADIMEKVKNALFEDDSGSSVFITRDDMEKVSNSIFWSMEELELIFDELNNEGKGYLTFEEFTLGLKNHMSSDKNPWNQKRKRKSTQRLHAEFTNLSSIEEADAEEKKQFMSLMEHLGAQNIFEDETEIWKLWTKLGRDEPHLLGNLEELLAKVTGQIKEARKEKETLEMALKKRISDHNEEVQCLYEEMEQQIHAERERLINESDVRSNIRSMELKKMIEVKNKDVQQLVAVQDELERELHNLRSTQQITKTENEKLKRTNQDLEHQLEKIRDQLSEAQGCLSEMKHKMAHSDSERERKDITVPLTISSYKMKNEERTHPRSKDTLMDQTDPNDDITLSSSQEALREQLNIDEPITHSSSQIFFQEESQKDKNIEMGEVMPEPTVESEEMFSTVIFDHNNVERIRTNTSSDQPTTTKHKGDILFDQTPVSVTRVISIEEDPVPELFIKDNNVPEAEIYEIQDKSSHSHYDVPTEKNSDKLMYEQIIPEMEKYVSFGKNNIGISKNFPDVLKDQPEISLRILKPQKDIFLDQTTRSSVSNPDHFQKQEQTLKSGSVRGSDKSNQKPLQVEISQIIKELQSGTLTEEMKVQMNKKVTFQENVPKCINDENKQDIQKPIQNNEEKRSLSHPTGQPDHVYKILFVGNSSVGKTSFLHRVHDGAFHQGYSATVGIDCRIKILNVDDKHFALQLWDTAGQERFHSITEHFFRKADGLVIMYDVTSKDTFSAVQYWLSCIMNKTQDDIVILLMGNKIDCEVEREVTTADGEELAQEYKLLFAECSAASGIYITEALIDMARSLKKHEDDMKNNVVKLRQPTEKNKSCCF
ncbi:EF-hand calcium-binding domain-containing protein 4B isoform X2 [Xenopus laevis]|uniref:EF-hand calcium-binding domain-containing protein 4B isoform X2 n=1 Tax=Xenopus laevis TaxID=8355 RepID=A0A8J0U661_XENLA|nr:EF-hand calcium-binding domain-containing protein 4B isoform X2 [Xenopus laevis]